MTAERASRPATAGSRGTAVRFVVCVLVSVFIMLAASICSLAFGAKPMSLHSVLEALQHPDVPGDDASIIYDSRLPRTGVAILVGGALGAAGAVMQGLTRNPLADPGILGVSGGSALAVVIAIVGFGVTTASGYVWFALVGALIASLLVLALGGLGRGRMSPVRMALAGAVMSAFLGSITSAMLLLDRRALEGFRVWSAGSVAGRPLGVLKELAPFLAVGLLIALALGARLNSLALGDDLARGLGANPAITRVFCVLCTVLLVGGATAAAGPIGFIGLMVPHAARYFVGHDYRRITLISALTAPSILLLADVAGRVLGRPGEVQVGIMSALLGAPVFVLLARRPGLVQL